mmetsp:Transcript_102609/g.289958  ORF Transcript_102609/g.289958 Transcript_102609/m.289958 type:complete len:246 (-) Transcript_102609:1022-1759(-)
MAMDDQRDDLRSSDIPRELRGMSTRDAAITLGENGFGELAGGDHLVRLVAGARHLPQRVDLPAEVVLQVLHEKVSAGTPRRTLQHRFAAHIHARFVTPPHASAISALRTLSGPARRHASAVRQKVVGACVVLTNENVHVTAREVLNHPHKARAILHIPVHGARHHVGPVRPIAPVVERAGPADERARCRALLQAGETRIGSPVRPTVTAQAAAVFRVHRIAALRTPVGGLDAVVLPAVGVEVRVA